MNPDPQPGFFRRLLGPLLGILPAILALVANDLMHRTEIGLDYLMTMQWIVMLSVMFSMAFILLWFTFFSGIRWAIRGGVLGSIALSVLALVLLTAKVEFDGSFIPHFTFVWQKTGEQKFNEYLAQKQTAEDPAELTLSATDSSGYRGNKGDGTALHLKLNTDWTANPPKLLWKHPVGIGHGGIAVAGNSALTLEQRGENEALVCYDRLTGKERWVHSYPARFEQTEPMGGNGPRTTPLIHEGNVIALGATGELSCVEGNTGKPRWQTNIIKEAGADIIDWGVSGSPAIIGNVVVVNPGTDKARTTTGSVAGYDLSTGKKLWSTANRTSGYASPMAVTLGETKQALAFDALALAGFDPQSGKELWAFPWRTDMGMNSAQPVVVGNDRIFLSSEKSNGGAMIQLKQDGEKWNVTELWNNRSLSARFTNPILVKDHLFGLSDGRLICVDVKAGKRKWADGSFGNGQMILTQNAIVITSEDGSLACVAADPTEYNLLGEIEVFDARTWNLPTIAGNQLFMRNHREMAVFELPEAK